MNKKGFTLVEILSVIVLLGLIIGIAVPGVMRAQRKAKEKTLATKVKNIEKAAVLYGQDNREKFTLKKEDGYCNGISDCYYYENESKVTTIKVSDLIDKYITADEGNNIKNPTDEIRNLNDCPIQIYKKYGKIYAVYLDKEKNSDCWVQR